MLIDLLFFRSCYISYMLCKCKVINIGTWIDKFYTNHKRKGIFVSKIPQWKSPWWHWVLNLQPSNPDLLQLDAVPTGFSHYHGSIQTVPIQVASTLGGPLCSSCQQAVRNTVQTFPEPVLLKIVCLPSAWLTCSRNRARLCFLSAAPGDLKHYTGPKLHYFSLWVGTAASNMAWSADMNNVTQRLFNAHKKILP